MTGIATCKITENHSTGTAVPAASASKKDSQSAQKIPPLLPPGGFDKALTPLEKTTIEAEITEINKEIEDHSKKWFNTFRSCNYTNQIENLKKHVKILDNRFDLYMKIIF